MNTADESELPSQAVTVFAWSSKKHVVLCYPVGRLCVFCWLILNGVHQVLPTVGLIRSSTVGSNCLVFKKELIIEDSLPIPPYTQHHLLWIKTSLCCGWWWFILLAPCSIPHCAQYSIHYSLPITICFKNRTFLLCLSRELHVEIQSRRCFFFLFNLCGTQTSKWLI